MVGEREVKDIADWAVPNEADYIALSFVQSAGDVKECRKHFGGKDIKAGGFLMWILSYFVLFYIDL